LYASYVRVAYLFDVAAGGFTNITDDGTSDVIGEDSDGALVDIMPFWSPSGDALLLGVPVPRADGSPVILASFDHPLSDRRYALSQSINQSLQTLNAQSQVLIGGYLYTFERTSQNMFGS